MMKRRRMIALALVALSLVSFVSAAYAGARSSEIIRSSSANLGADKKASFSIKAKVNCASIGLTKYTLYTSGGSVVTSKTVSSYGNGYNYSTSIDLSAYIQSGVSYYVSGELYADGETRTATSGIRQY